MKNVRMMLHAFLKIRTEDSGLIKEDSIYVFTATEGGGIRRAINGFEYSYTPEVQENVTLT